MAKLPAGVVLVFWRRRAAGTTPPLPKRAVLVALTFTQQPFLMPRHS